MEPNPFTHRYVTLTDSVQMYSNGPLQVCKFESVQMEPKGVLDVNQLEKQVQG